MTTTITTQHQIINPLCSSIFVKRILTSTIQQLDERNTYSYIFNLYWHQIMQT